MKYALHLGIVADSAAIGHQELFLAVRNIIAPGFAEIGRTVVDGDRFEEWGEPTTGPDDILHGVVYFSAPDHEGAWTRGEWLYQQLKNTPTPMHTQFRLINGFSITLAFLWSAGVGEGGVRFGDDDEQAAFEAEHSTDVVE